MEPRASGKPKGTLREESGMKEVKGYSGNGFIALVILLASLGFSVYAFVEEWWVWGCIALFVSLVLMTSITVVQPNQAAVVTFFGQYLGTIRKSGIHFVVPFSIRHKVSLRVRNFNSSTLKVNDIDGNPVEIAAVVVFRVVDTAKALFDVDKYEQFVETQSESALRHVATKYPYDNGGGEGVSLRGDTEVIAVELTRELQERLSAAGVEVIESRLTHLAYAPEIAGAMLQRQQASAIVAARHIIVEGAVGMVQAAIEQLEKEGYVLDEERKAAMMNNLMVAIVSDRSAQPVVNAGSLY
jgi:regulator of protease activity HflC (stomatin/prohibitin superfamily)